jgi:hypothetical protein
MPFVVASQISPSGTLAGKYGIGIISLGSMSTQARWRCRRRVCRGRREAWHHREPRELARAAHLAYRREPRTGAARGGPD